MRPPRSGWGKANDSDRSGLNCRIWGDTITLGTAIPPAGPAPGRYPIWSAGRLDRDNGWTTTRTVGRIHGRKQPAGDSNETSTGNGPAPERKLLLLTIHREPPPRRDSQHRMCIHLFVENDSRAFALETKIDMPELA